MRRVQLEKSLQSPPFELIDIVVRAGAGAGKTTELTQRVLRLAQDFQRKNGKYPHFVVTTFTRKATQELKERLLKEAMKLGDAGLMDFVKRPSHLHISTIHGVLSQFLSRYGSAIKLSPRLSVVSELTETNQMKKRIRELCHSDEEFNRDFQVLLEHAEFVELLDAFRVYFRLFLQFGNPKHFDSGDFARISAAKGAEILRLIRDYASLIRSASLPEAWQELALYLENSMRTLTPQSPVSDWIFFTENLPKPRASKNTPDGVLEAREGLRDGLEFFKSWRVQDSYWQAHEELCVRLGRCASKMSQELRELKVLSGEVTMQDLETLSLHLIRESPQAADAFSKTWDYWLVDEYQDTSPIQVELIRNLSSASKCFVVGDPQQSIYLFRGARSEVFSQREKEVQKNQGVLFSKLTNYRSQPELLEFFNDLFTNLDSQFQPMFPREEVVSCSGQPVAEVLQVTPPEDEPQEAEFEAVLFRCQELIARQVPKENICVLGRSNKDLEKIAWMAQGLGIPVQLHTSGRFFERREVSDALALLKFLCNPHDNKNLLQILRSPVFRLADQILYEWCQEAGASFWQTFVRKSSPVIQKLAGFLQSAQVQGVGQTWRDLLVEEGYFKYAHTLDPSGRREANLWKLIQMVRSDERMPGFSYHEFLKSLDLRALSTEEGDESEAVPVIEPQKIHLMTVHASKGLQFAHVILPKMGQVAPPPSTQFFLFEESTGCWTLSPPEPDQGRKTASLSGVSLMEKIKERQKKEEDRVLYVALTRAQETVTLIWSDPPKDESWAGRLRLQRTDGVHCFEKFAYQVRTGHFQPVQARVQEVEPLQEISALALNPTVGEMGFQTLSVTEILDQKKSGPRSSAAMADVQKAVTGVDVHRLFESLKYKFMRDPSFDWRSLATGLPVSHQKALEYLAQDENGRWLEVIRQGEVEFGMAVVGQGRLIQGQIDLWGRDSQNQIWIVDYKTGSPQYQEKAFDQLKIYSWALRKMSRIGATEDVQLAVIYPFSEKTFYQKAPSLDEVEKELFKN